MAGKGPEIAILPTDPTVMQVDSPTPYVGRPASSQTRATPGKSEGCTWISPSYMWSMSRVAAWTRARTEAANLNAKDTKRAGRGYVNHDSYQARIPLAAIVKNTA